MKLDAAGVAVGLLLIATMAWLALEIRRLHASAIPALRAANSPLVQGLAAIGGTQS